MTRWSNHPAPTYDDEGVHRHNQMEAHMDQYLKVLAALTIGLLALLLRTAQPATADEPNPVTAIDIVLEPDATMVKHAEAANERLLKEFPKGFALGKAHHPHIS